MTRQAIQLGLLPRLVTRHTSTTETGQTFLPVITSLLLLGVAILVLSSETSMALAAAYGIAVSGTMIVTTVLAYLMPHRVWGLSKVIAMVVLTPILLIDAAFLVANLAKVPDGGYVQLPLAATLVIMAWTWALGTQWLFEQSRKLSVPLADFVPRIEKSSARRTSEIAVFLTSDLSATPPALLHNLKHNHVSHAHIIVLKVETRRCAAVGVAPATTETLSPPWIDKLMRWALVS